MNGEDLRDRWHNALKSLDDDVEIDPEDIKMRVRDMMELKQTYTDVGTEPLVVSF